MREALYRLDVITTTTADVVQSVGCWLIDRAFAGWDVTVACTSERNERALKILGVGTTSVEAMLQPADDPACSASLAIAGQTLAADRDLVRWLTDLVWRQQVDVTVWGDVAGNMLDHLHLEPMHYQISTAAAAFKAHALNAVGLSHLPVAEAESFRQSNCAMTTAAEIACIATAGR